MLGSKSDSALADPGVPYSRLVLRFMHRRSDTSTVFRLMPLLLIAGACASASHISPSVPSGIQLEGPYARADSIALTVPEPAERTVSSLARALTRDLETERDKVRSIYRWMTENIAYDRDAYLSGDLTSMIAHEVLQSRMAVCDGYAALFQELARRAGIQTVSIEGYAKAYGFREGDGFDRTNHKWNAVFVEGEWRLIDSTWGAGYLDDARWVRSFDDRFFLTPPERMIVTHLPEESSWQLLDARLSMADFLALPVVPQTIQALGASLEDVRRVAERPDFRGFVAMYDSDGLEIDFLRIPIEQYLPAGQVHTFELSVNDVQAVIISNWTERHRFDASSGVFSKSLQLTPGEWRVMAQPEGADHTITLLRYQVE